MKISDTLKRAIQQVSAECSYDLEVEDGEDFAYCLAEVTLDAGRLGMFGHEDAQGELEKLLEEFDFSTICEEAKKIVQY